MLHNNYPCFFRTYKPVVWNILFVFIWVCMRVCVCPPRASFIQQPRGNNNLLPVLMVHPAAPVWIGFRGHQSQAIRSKWSLCNTRQTAKSFITKPRLPFCVCCCVYMCVCVLLQYSDPLISLNISLSNRINSCVLLERLTC